MSDYITSAEATTILRDLARGREDGDGGDVWPLYDRAEDAMRQVIALDLAATRLESERAAERTRADAAEAECVRLTTCLARANATIEETERARYAAEDERDTARSALDGLVAAVRAEREAERGHAAVRADDASRGRHLRAAEAAVDKARHATDALISAAPAPTTVPAMVVRAYLRADARSATGTHADATALAAARTALDAALAGCA